MIVFDTENAEASMNMALDESMLWFRSLSKDNALHGSVNESLLRFYGWKPSAVSLGRYQRSERYLSLDAIKENGLQIVRRPTGGKALIHQHELTYCLVLSEKSSLGRLSIRESHKLIGKAIAQGIVNVGIKASLGYLTGSGSKNAGNPCFKEHLAESVLVGGRKVAGSAQLRQNGIILQHGSILLSVDYDLHQRIFGESAANLEENAAGLFDISSLDFSINELKRTIADALSEELCEDVTKKCKVPEFIREYAEKLRIHKYSSINWPKTYKE